MHVTAVNRGVHPRGRALARQAPGPDQTGSRIRADLYDHSKRLTGADPGFPAGLRRADSTATRAAISCAEGLPLTMDRTGTPPASAAGAGAEARSEEHTS